MEIIKLIIYYISVVSITVLLAVLGWKLGGKLKNVKKAARHKKDLKVIEEFQGESKEELSE